MSSIRTLRTEQQVRTDLAAAYRLAALAGWDDTVYTHISAALPAQPGVYLINEFGLGFDEVTASNLVKVNLHGAVVDGSGRQVNPTGVTIHGAVHAARPGVECVLHLHAPWGGWRLPCFQMVCAPPRNGPCACITGWVVIPMKCLRWAYKSSSVCCAILAFLTV